MTDQRVNSSVAERPHIHAGNGGSNPTLTLQLRKADWIVADVDIDIARNMIRFEHYAKGASNTFTYLHGLFPRDWHWHEECAGVAWWIPPTRPAAESVNREGWQGVLALSRLAITPDTPKNAASYLISRSVRMIDRAKWHTLISYADEWQGHKGTIYEACGWTFDGMSKPEATYIRNGRMVSRKAGPRTRTHAEMLANGAAFVGKFAKRRYVLRVRP